MCVDRHHIHIMVTIYIYYIHMMATVNLFVDDDYQFALHLNLFGGSMYQPLCL